MNPEENPVPVETPEQVIDATAEEKVEEAPAEAAAE